MRFTWVALIFYNITRCYGKHVAVIVVAVAPGDIIKYQSFVYGSFVWEIHVRYNKISYYLLEVFVFDNADVYSSMLNKKDKINQV